MTKVKVVDCDDIGSFPNHITDPDHFCGVGLPFVDHRFECWDGSDNPFGYGRCRECWSDTFDEQGCDGLGGFCFEGMCDDSVTCWSGQLEDAYEEEGGGESPVKVGNNGSQTNTVVRSLFRKPDPSSGQVQDLDSLYVVPDEVYGIGTKYVTIRVRNQCFFGKYLDEPMEEVEVKLQQLSPIYILAPYADASYEDITDWEHPLRKSGLQIPLGVDEFSAFYSGFPLRVQVRNVGSPLEEFTYTLEVTISPQLPEPIFVPDLSPGTIIVDPMSEASIDLDPGEVSTVVPDDSAINTGGRLFFAPGDGTDTGSLAFVLKNNSGEIVRDGFDLHGGLAISLEELSPRSGPYRGVLSGLRETSVVGRVTICPEGTNDCSMYEPSRDVCGAQEGEICCVDDNGGYFALDPEGGDAFNCGACGLACDWDETCLKGACVTGEATRCWNTGCPSGTFCISDGWFGADPRCEAILVDREHCGWFEDVCDEDEMCLSGFCMPRLSGDCDAVCGEGEACCWKGGVETCVDVTDNPLDCGACGNVCDVGGLCEEGICAPWYTVFDPCPFGLVNCGEGGEIDCVDVDTDEGNCGGCGLTCGDFSWCENGMCYTEVHDVVIDD